MTEELRGEEFSYRVFQLDGAKLASGSADAKTIRQRTEAVVAAVLARLYAKTVWPILVLDDIHTLPHAALDQLQDSLMKFPFEFVMIATTTPKGLKEVLRDFILLEGLPRRPLPPYGFHETLRILTTVAERLVAKDGTQLVLRDIYNVHHFATRVKPTTQPAGSIVALQWLLAKNHSKDLFGKLGTLLQTISGVSARPSQSPAAATPNPYVDVLPDFLKKHVHGQPTACDAIATAFESWMDGRGQKVLLIGPERSGQLLSVRIAVRMCAIGFDPLVLVDAHKPFNAADILRAIKDKARPVIFVRDATAAQAQPVLDLLNLLHPPDQPEGNPSGALVFVSLAESLLLLSRHTHRGTLHPIGQLKTRSRSKRALGPALYGSFDRFIYYLPPNNQTKFDFVRGLVDDTMRGDRRSGALDMDDAAIQQMIDAQYAQDRDEAPFYPWAKDFIDLCLRMTEISAHTGIDVGMKDGVVKLDGEMLRTMIDMMGRTEVVTEVRFSTGQS